VSDARFSPCRTWRYSLTRAAAPAGDGTVVFIGLNPSTADETRDDPTTRRCIGFARDWGFARMELVNVFGFRSTRPAELRAAADPVGPGNAAAVGAAVEAADLVVCAWGNDGVGPDADALLRLVARPHCVGTTLRGAPRHPLYVRASARPSRFPRNGLYTPSAGR
jgi:hypothetical protein